MQSVFFSYFGGRVAFYQNTAKLFFYSKIITYKDRKRHNYQSTRVFGNRCLGEQGVCC